MIEPWCDVISIPAGEEITLKLVNPGSEPEFSVEANQAGKVLDGDYTHVYLLKGDHFVDPLQFSDSPIKRHDPKRWLVRLLAIAVGMLVGYLIFK